MRGSLEGSNPARPSVSAVAGNKKPDPEFADGSGFVATAPVQGSWITGNVATAIQT